MVTLNKNDLVHILDQILIAERHSQGVPLSQLVSSPLLPQGLRTVDGSFNNFQPGMEYFGASDQPMKRLMDIQLGAADINPRTGQPTSYTQTSGSVYDAEPRVISNLVADQSLNNPAAIAAALAVNGVTGAQVLALVEEIGGAQRIARDAQTAAEALPEGAERIAALEEAATLAQAARDLAISHGITMDGENVFVRNIAADLGDTASFNGFMTIFGQFFDHGLDLTGKGGSGTVYIPLAPDDPLYVPGSQTNFMVLTRATNAPGADGIVGTADDVREHRNQTTPWIDLNQLYTSNASHQVFLRDYDLVDGRPVATGKMLESATGGPPTWADVKAQAENVLGITLSDLNVHAVPALLTDLYGNFIPGENGFPQLVLPAPATPLEGNLTTPADAMQAVSAGRAFLDDIAHNAAPGTYVVDRFTGETAQKTADADTDTGNAIIPNQFGQNATYDNELLDRHYIVGDGRGNENIALTSIHTVFHGEHNRQIEEVKLTAIAEAQAGDLAFLNQWLAVPVTELPADLTTLHWNGERLFQAARFSTEMVYQHLVFEEFVRAISPQIDPFVFSNSVQIDGAIFEEFAQVVYRFGHSMLNETVPMLKLLQGAANPSEVGLIEAFLNPVLFDQQGTDAHAAAGSILRGMTRQAGNEIDEFMTSALRSNLVGLPLDLAALNIARARDTGVPSLNAARKQLFDQTGDTFLKPYDSWTDFAGNLKNPLSVMNFIAAYGTHPSILAATTAEAKRDAAMMLVFGGGDAPADRLDYVNGVGTWAGRETGLNDVDFWIGGLAEALMPFGGMLGSTFNYVFELQMQNLQAGDRFYYLSRTQGMHLLTELESDSFADLIRRNTDTEGTGLHINGAAFQTADYILEMDRSRQWNDGLGDMDPEREADVLAALQGNTALVQRADTDGDGDDDVLRYLGGEHVVLGGTDEADTLIGGAGDDALWGEAGDDVLEGGLGVDHIHGGSGNDIITDAGTDVGAADVLKGEEGDDVINGGMGLDLVFGGAGKDVLSGGSEAKDIFGGTGDDFIRAASGGGGVVQGNEGDDWMEGQGNMNTLTGDNSELFFNSRVIGHDVMLAGENDTDFDAESGDDIMVQGIGINRNNGMAGFDWASFQGNDYAVDADMNISIFVNQQNNILRDRYDLVEGLSGWKNSDTLRGRDAVLGAYDANGNAIQVGDSSPIESFSNALLEKNLDRIAGLRDLVAHLDRFDLTHPRGTTTEVATAVMDTSDASDIILGGAGSDLIEGRAGNDILDGDRYLDVRIAITDAAGAVFATAERLTAPVFDLNGAVMFAGQTLERLLFTREVTPGQLSVQRSILNAGAGTDTDVALFWDVRANYEITANADGSLTVEHITATAGQIDPATGRGRALEGRDMLRNFEVLRFADGDIATSAFFIDAPVEGLPVITDVSPTETQPVTVDLTGIVDPDGIASTAVQWQSSLDGITWTNIAGATATTYTPPAAATAAQPFLRVEATVTDAMGRVTVLHSAATDVVGDVLNGNAQANVLTGGAGGDLISGNDGNDTIRANGSDDVIVWNVGNGIDRVDGGTETVVGDTFIVNGNDQSEHFRIYTAAEWAASAPGRTAPAGTEIVVTRQTLGLILNGPETVVAHLSEIEELVINTAGDGVRGDRVQIIGNFDPTQLSQSTITINGSAGNDSVDISTLDSAHRIVFRTAGGMDTVIGTLRPQDVIEAPTGVDPAAYQSSYDPATGMVTLSTAGSSIRFAGSPDALPQIVAASNGDHDGAGQDAARFTARDATGLLNLVRGGSILPAGSDDAEAEGMTGVRDLPGAGNSLTLPGLGAAGDAFIRLTEARYAGTDAATGAGIVNPIFRGLDARAISDALGTQEAGTPQSTQANIFYMAFGQYFDHGLSFIPKGGAGSIQIGAPGAGRSPSANNPADLTRAKVVGTDAEGQPIHANITSPFVDQNQVYGSSSLIGQLLRESDGAQGLGARLVFGGEDPSAPGHDLLPTLRGVLDHHIAAGTVFTAPHLGAGMTLTDYYPGLVRADGSYDPAVVATLAGDFMGEGWPLLLDTNPFINLLDHVVAGDGRVNENVTLTAMHTIFARNHNHHVDALAAVYADQGIVVTPEELFQAAKIVNEAEYQRVVFTEFAEKLLGGQGIMGQGDHGFDQYMPDADPRISHEFAGAAYRIGHTMISQTINLLNPDGTLREVPLFDAFLNPTDAAGAFTVDPDGAGPAPTLTGAAALQALAGYGYAPQPGYAQVGVASVLGGIVQQAAEDVDVNMVDAVRNDLVRISADLFAFNVARGWDLGLGTLNQVRGDLMASTNRYIVEARGYAGGDLSPYADWTDFQTRNGLSDALITQFKAAYPDLVLAADEVAAFQAVNPDIALVDNGDGTMTVKGIDRVDLWVGGLAEAKINGGMAGQTFWVILHEQLDRLQEADRFYYIPRLENFDLYGTFVEGQSFADIVMRNTGLTGLDERIFDLPADDRLTPALPEGATAPEAPAPDAPAGGEPTPPAGGEPTPPTSGEQSGTTTPPAGGEPTPPTGGEQSGTTTPPAGGEPTPPAADPTVAEVAFVMGTADADTLSGGVGVDFVDAGAGADQITTLGGDDVIMAGAGHDAVTADAGNDIIDGGKGNDALFGGAGDDTFLFANGDGSDMIFGGDGIDTIDLSALTGGAKVDLGSLGAIGSVSVGTLVDRILSVENIIGGKGDDHITANTVANVLAGGEGNDVFAFTSLAAVDGDRVLDFSPGDVIDLSALDAHRGAAGNQSFTLASAGQGPAAGLLTLTELADGVTRIEGHVDEDGTADFTLDVIARGPLGDDSFRL